jgi:hypothetical protein
MTKILSWILGAVVVLGGIYYFFLRVDSVETTTGLEDAGSIDVSEGDLFGTMPADESGKKMAFSEFLKQGGSYKCEVNQYVNEMETKGTTYINDGMIRGEYNTKVQNMNVDSTMIVRDGYTYSWTSVMPTTGFKAKVAEVVGGDAVAGPSGQYSFNATQIGDYNCEAWTADASKFTIPTNITFKDVDMK